MRVRIGSIEIIDPTWEELDALIERYGTSVQQDGEVVEQSERLSANAARRPSNGSGIAKDRVLLDRLVAAGSAGVPSQELGEILGRLGKSIRPGLVEWARRIGLTGDENFDPFEECRCGSRRGIRLKNSLLSVAKEIQQG